jgi:hypothetical protein
MTPLADHRGEPDQHQGRGVRLEHHDLDVGTDVVRHLQPAEGAAALGMGLALRLAVELRHLFAEVVILQEDSDSAGPPAWQPENALGTSSCLSSGEDVGQIDETQVIFRGTCRNCLGGAR